MTELLTAAQMRDWETAAMQSGAVIGLDLMERAGRGVVTAIFDTWPNLAQGPHQAVVLCGPGNNGGDGFVIARLLHDWGWEVAVFLLGTAANLPPDAKTNHDRWCERGTVAPWDRDRIAAVRADLCIDAVFGAGLARAPSADIMIPLTRLAETVPVVAVDAPTGLCMDSGIPLSAEFGTVSAQLTVTFHQKRPGHFLADGPRFCGAVRVVDIGLTTAHRAGLDPGLPCALLDPPPGLAAAVDKGASGSEHKYDHGHALVLSGPPGTGGAARLAARGALRVGAGLVSVCCGQEAVPEHAARLDAIMLKPADGPRAFADLLGDPRYSALCLGPGLGRDRARDLVPVALAAGRATVLDADALTAFADAPVTLFDQVHDRCVLTPHTGEFKRLFPDIAERLSAPPARGPAFSKVDATRQAAARAGCVVLFKGPDTVIAAPDGRASIHAACYDRAAPWLATAGSGDVLAGIITGLLARGIAPMQAAEIGAWLHVEAAREVGPGLIAEDLPEHLPKVFRRLGL